MKRARAVRFDKELPEGGRSRPLLVEVEDGESQYVDAVVKLASAAATLDGRRLVREAVSASLAARLALPIPGCLAVEISESFIAAIEADDARIGSRLREHVRIAGAWAYGSTYYPAHGVVVPRWPIPEHLKLKAAEIFAFDALTLNRDRCIPSVGNPNCLTNGVDLVMIDHEQALDAEVIGLDGSQAPWRMGSLDDMQGLLEHIFIFSLRGSVPDLARIEAEWAAIGTDERKGFFQGVPIDWDPDHSEKQSILGYLTHLHANLPAAFDEVRRVLA